MKDNCILHIGTDEYKISILFVGRTHPNANDFWDGNWLTCQIKIEIQGFIANFTANMRNNELEELSNSLAKLYNELKGIVEFRPLEPFIQFNFRIDKSGKIRVKCEAQYPLGVGGY